jgi:ubiquinone/menaquinone biosynthesis C-methylase UbiE
VPLKPDPPKYIHGFSKTEQARLLEQARMLETSIFKRIDLSGSRSVLDLGCGVGAQSRHLIKRWPQLTVTGVDASAEQLTAAERLLRVETRTKRFVPVQAKADSLPFKDGSFDAVFICFVLEHLSDPAAALKEARRVVKKGGSVYCTEVFNSGVYMYPHHASVEKYWAAFNAHQRLLGGDPDIGIKLPALLTSVGFAQIDYFESAGPLMDRRMKSPSTRRRFMRIWHDLFCGPGEALCRAGQTDADQMDAMRRHLLHLAKNPEGIFFYAAFQAHAVKG